MKSILFNEWKTYYRGINYFNHDKKKKQKQKLEDSKVQRGEKWSWDMNPDSLVPNPKLSSTLWINK